MRRATTWSMTLIMIAWAWAHSGISLGQSAQATSTGSFTNPAVFVTRSGDFTNSVSMSKTDVEKGCKPASGTVVFNVDATSSYTIVASITSARFTGTGSPQLGNSTDLRDAFHINLTPNVGAEVCPGGVLTPAGFNGAVGSPSATGAPTSGTPGHDWHASVAIYFVNSGAGAGADAHLLDAPTGTYEFTATVTVTD